MIDFFNEVEIRPTGVVHESTFQQIKKMYLVDPERAGELAISAIELILTDQISSDDVMIDMLLTPAQIVNDNNVFKYEMKMENSKQKKIRDMKLVEIAEMMKQGLKQKEIAQKIGTTQQNISYRVGVIRAQYPDLLLPQGAETADTNENVCTNDTNLYKNKICTNGTNDTNENVCTKEVFVKNEDGQKVAQSFRF